MATPTFVTGEPNLVQPTSLPTAVDVLPPTTLPLVSPPTAALAQIVTPGVISAVDTRAFALSITNGVFSGRLFEMPGGTLTFAQDPLNANRLALVDARGLLFVFHDFAGGQGARVASSPFSEPEPVSAETNNARVTQIAYSPDGRYLAFLIDTDSDDSNDNDSSNDGVWILPLASVSGQPAGGAAILLRDCPPEAGCMIVDRPDSPYRYRSQTMMWSVSGDALIITLELPDESRQGVAIVYPDVPNTTERPPILRYDYATWANDGQRLVVSGRGPDGRIVVGMVNRQGGEPQLRDVLLMGIGWAEFAVQRPNGQVVFLGGPGNDSPLRIYNGDGIALTAPIGNAPPVKAVWSPDRSAVMVMTEENGRTEYYVALVDSGQVQRITDQAGGAMALAWTSGLLSSAASGSVSLTPSAPVDERLAVVIAGDGLFIRSAPSSSAEVVASVLFDQTVTITGEGVNADGILWYPARAPDGATGWIAGRIDGAETLRF
ncbi:MAG: SH3 domain-containing protein [Anaerolineae bacterium]|nr:SH3 domain-containing protein [Anaerolineae bacterium]